MIYKSLNPIYKHWNNENRAASRFLEIRIFTVRLLALGTFKREIEKSRLKGSPPHSPLRCLSGQFFESGILLIFAGQLGTREERNKGCGGGPFNLNFLNFSFKCSQS